jgi:hypothetical protein
MATYQGSPFEAGIGPTDGDIVLFAACPPPEELGFEPATGHWRKQLPFGEVQAVWESKPIGKFRGERCIILDDLGDRLHIGYLGHDGYKAEQLGYWQVDRGVFELVAPRTEVSDILEERAEYGRPGSSTDGAGRPAPRPGDSAGYTISRRNDSTGYTIPRRNDSAGYTIPRRNDSAGYPAPITAADLTGHLPPSTDLPELGGYPNSAAQSASAYSWQPGEPAHPLRAAADGPPAEAGGMTSTAYRAVPDGITGVALPVAAEVPLPLEAEALRAASAARRPQQAAPMPASTALDTAAPSRTGLSGAGLSGAGLSDPGPAHTVSTNTGSTNTGSANTRSANTLSANTGSASSGPTHTRRGKPAPSRPRRGARRRMATERLFADLASDAGIPSDAYAIGEDVEGALCLVQAGEKFEVYHSSGGAQHELQVFPTEESACFYLFGVLAAEAVRNGTLGRVPTEAHASSAS